MHYPNQPLIYKTTYSIDFGHRIDDLTYHQSLTRHNTTKHRLFKNVGAWQGECTQQFSSSMVFL